MNEPLVSVAVITYNSSKTVVETLDSVYNQSYPNLELIVSDDCSSDSTVEICREWIETHKDRFIRVELLLVEKNTGVSANMNRAENACRGEWVKPIAGDDVLLPQCIEKYFEYVCQHPEAEYVFAKVKVFGGDEKRCEEVDSWFIYDFFRWSVKEQYDYLTLVGNCIPAASFFYDKRKNDFYGIKNDERIPLLEDWPKWIRMLEKGIRFCFIEETTVKYRISEKSLSTQEQKTIAYEKSNAKVYVYYRFRNDYKNNKREAVLRWLGMRKTIDDNGLFWRVLLKLYKTIYY